MQRASISMNPCALTLSRRQTECLFYLIRGKTGNEIAALLTIKSRTVEYHLEEIKCKMGVSTKSELIEHAMLKDILI
jgi:DNA-binding CsgD family transcriptional regulator